MQHLLCAASHVSQPMCMLLRVLCKEPAVCKCQGHLGSTRVPGCVRQGGESCTEGSGHKLWRAGWSETQTLRNQRPLYLSPTQPSIHQPQRGGGAALESMSEGPPPKGSESPGQGAAWR